MEYINKSQLWKYLGEQLSLRPGTYDKDCGFTELQWTEIQKQNALKSKENNEILKGFIGLYFKDSLLITDITDDTIHSRAIEVIPLKTNDGFNIRHDHHLHFKYDSSFKEKLLSYRKGGNAVKLEGKILSTDFVNGTTLQLTSIERGFCFIATACYGSYDAPEVIILRKYRDDRLSRTLLGNFLIKVYYKLSPPFALLISKSSILRAFIRKIFLTPLSKRIERHKLFRHDS